MKPDGCDDSIIAVFKIGKAESEMNGDERRYRGEVDRQR